MADTKRLLPALLIGMLALSGCSSAPSDEEVDGAWDACVEGFNDRPEVIAQAWTDEYEAVWKIGNLWWTFGAGDICESLQRDIDARTWVDHTSTPSWYVDYYLS